MLRPGESLAEGQTTPERCNLPGKQGFAVAPGGQSHSLARPLLQEHTAWVRPLSPREQHPTARVGKAPLCPLHAPRCYVNTVRLFLAAVKCTSADAKLQPLPRAGAGGRESPAAGQCRKLAATHGWLFCMNQAASLNFWPASASCIQNSHPCSPPCLESLG